MRVAIRALAGGALLVSFVPVRPPEGRSEGTGSPDSPAVGPRRARAGTSDPPLWEDAHLRRADRVAADCGLALHSACDGQGCVAVTRSPDLDSGWGWVQAGLGRPVFAVTAVAGDLGLPTSRWPCRGAVDALAGGGVLALELPGGDEIWCAPDAGIADPSARILCDRAAATAYGPDATGFTAAGEGIRVLSLR